MLLNFSVQVGAGVSNMAQGVFCSGAARPFYSKNTTLLLSFKTACFYVPLRKLFFLQMSLGFAIFI